MKARLFNVVARPRIVLLGITSLLMITMTGCACGPFSENVGYERTNEWKPQNLKAQFVGYEKAIGGCAVSLMDTCVATMKTSCKNRSKTIFKNAITDEPLSETEIDDACRSIQNKSYRVCTTWPHFSAEAINACMTKKGFKEVEVKRAVCMPSFHMM
jgi:hypothetical protein